MMRKHKERLQMKHASLIVGAIALFFLSGSALAEAALPNLEDMIDIFSSEQTVATKLTLSQTNTETSQGVQEIDQEVAVVAPQKENEHRDPFAASRSMVITGAEEVVRHVTGIRTRSIASTSRAALGNLTFSGYWLGKELKTAFINEQMFHEGDSLGAFKIKKIKRGEVLLEADGETYHLRLSSQ